MTRTQTVLREEIRAALATVAADTATGMRQTDVPAALDAVEKVVDAVVLNKTNGEPFYQSRVTWGAVISILIPALGAAGLATEWIDKEVAVSVGVAIGSAIGGVITLYGRWKAKRPLGA